MAHDVFISYAIEDKSVADAVCQTLEKGSVRCWCAPRDVPYAVDYEDAIVDAISGSKLMVLILSSHSNNSAHVKREVQNACREEPQVPVLPFLVEDITLNKSLRYYIGSVNWLSALTPPLEAHLQKLVNYVHARLPQDKQDRDSRTQSHQPAQAEIIGEDEEIQIRVMEEETRLHAEEEAALRLTEEEAQRKHEVEEAERRRATKQTARVVPPRIESATEMPARDPSAVKTIPVPASTLDAAQAMSAGATPSGEGRSKRAMLIVIIACVVVLAAVAVVILTRQRGKSTQPITSQDAASTTAKQTGQLISPGGTIGTDQPPQPPSGMAYVPGGEFVMGRNDGGQYERPAHKVTVKSFFIDIYEVTNEEYEEFVKETNHLPPPTWVNGMYRASTARKPVTGVKWDDARAYAQWAGKRLPTEEEWEFAARGTDGRLYPWGNDWDKGLANADGASNHMADVGAFKGISPFGAFDMAGNAWEWTDSKLTPYPGGSLTEKLSADLKVIRGGTYLSKPGEATTTFRRGWRVSAEDDYSNTGFRCVKDIEN